MNGETDVAILGAGVSGLAAGAALGTHATILERSDRPGGLVRTVNRGGYWFDHVLHILHFSDPETQAWLTGLPGVHLAPCPPNAWVECAAGTARYPIQMHLAGLEDGAVLRCLHDLAEVTFRRHKTKPGSYEQWLRQKFGRGLCDLFMLPYNRKMWKRPLTDLAPTGFQWNIDPPDFKQVLLGAIQRDATFATYNATAFYPRPPRGAPTRGMEVVSRALARHVGRLRLGHGVELVDLENRVVVARRMGRRIPLRFREACLATIPLPELMRVCSPVPTSLRAACAALQRNRVLTATFSIRGPRPQGRGHWRYYADEALAFTRLIHMHEFDPLTAPEDGWGMMAEIVEPAERPLDDANAVLARVRRDIERIGAVPDDCRIIDQSLIVVDPAYVVFTETSQNTVRAATEFLQDHDVIPLGRYGRWEYSSMAQVVRDGLATAEHLLARLRLCDAVVQPQLADGRAFDRGVA